MGRKTIDVEKVAAAIEADVGEALPDLRQALAEATSGIGFMTTSDQLLVRRARERSGLDRVVFAEKIHTPVATLEDWEQGRVALPGGIGCLLKLLVKRPELLSELS